MSKSLIEHLAMGNSDSSWNWPATWEVDHIISYRSAFMKIKRRHASDLSRLGRLLPYANHK